ncbi:MAG: hypothetical protein A2539_05635 [Elusimicrobia bacterium RIFOXYD2_FULL_34_15]|nr:MAG: hypothetical protein A2539_05635 [Elusimicrobia bacterium RIFOXYD2_FULL_34_15]
MDKREIIEVMSRRTCCIKEAKDAFEEFLSAARKTLFRGEKIHLKGIGTLYVKMRKERRVRNPKTREIMKIKPKRVIRFKPSEIPIEN